jgi:hypothetical protein
MIGILSYTTLALSAAASVSALVLPRVSPSDKPAPEGWAHDFLEDYTDYHIRYLAIRCHEQHNTQFFDDCCHPLLATESLETARLPECIPTDDQIAAVTGAGPFDDDDSEEEFDHADDSDEEPSSPPATLSAQSEPTDNGDDNEPQGNGGKNQGDGESHDENAVEGGGENNEEGNNEEGNVGGKNNNDNQEGGDAPAPASGNGGDGEVISGGFATFYEQGGVAGACGNFHSDNDFVAALQLERYGDEDSVSSHCGRTLHITNTLNGHSVDVTVVDACPTCVNGNCVDLSPAAFEQLATFEEGMVPIEWTFTS